PVQVLSWFRLPPRLTAKRLSPVWPQLPIRWPCVTGSRARSPSWNWRCGVSCGTSATTPNRSSWGTPDVVGEPARTARVLAEPGVLGLLPERPSADPARGVLFEGRVAELVGVLGGSVDRPGARRVRDHVPLGITRLIHQRHHRPDRRL